jgi:magnesium-transporting ATPase (P-type)
LEKGLKNGLKKRLTSWKGKYLFVGGRLTLINLVLSSLPMYMMSFFAVPRGVLKKLDYFHSRFFWQQKKKNKYRLPNGIFYANPKSKEV